MSSESRELVLVKLVVEAGDERYAERLRALASGSLDDGSKYQALRLLDSIVGAEVMPLCRELASSPDVRWKTALLDFIGPRGTVDDAVLAIELAKRHLTGRTVDWGGRGTPVIQTMNLLDRVAGGTPERDDFVVWLGRRWASLSLDEQQCLRSIRPAIRHAPAVVGVIGSDSGLAAEAVDAFGKNFDSAAWEHLPKLEREGILSVDAVLALDADASRAAHRLQPPGLAIPVLRLKKLTKRSAVDRARWLSEAFRAIERLPHLFNRSGDA